MPETVAITLDVDWAPDFMIDATAELLKQARVKATWFLTHASPAVDRLRKESELFELGIHPNFLPSSTHGTTPLKVLAHCMGFAPKATSMRTHSLMQSTPLLDAVLQHTPITTDLTVFLPHVSNTEPFVYGWKGKELLRIPYVWEDDYEMEQKKPLWSLDAIQKSVSGAKIFNFHPIHIHLNSDSLSTYASLKKMGIPLTQLTAEKTASHRRSGDGTGTLFEEVVNVLKAAGRSERILDIRARLQEMGR